MTKKKITYKAFNDDMTCRGFQYEVGKTYNHTGNISCCNSGFHACENPLDILDYYNLTTSKFAIVEQSGEIKKEKDKTVSSSIKIEASLELDGLIKAAFDYIWNKCKSKTKDKDSAKLASSGDYAQLASSGDSAQLASSGDSAKLASSGDSAQLASSGDSAKLASSGDSAKLASSGDYAKLASSGDYAKLASSGDSAQLASSGYYAKLASSGDSAQLASSGDSAKQEISGKDGVAVSCGINGKVKGIRGTLIALTWFIDRKPKDIIKGRIGWGGLKPDTWYELDEKGKFIEA